MTRGILLLLALFGVLVGETWARKTTPLDDYVWAEDPTYKWELIQTAKNFSSTIYVIRLTSQTWVSEERVSQPVWWHDLIVAVPDEVISYEVGGMLIDGGSNGGGFPDPEGSSVALLALAAVSLGIVVGDLRQIPNQPITFYDDPSLKSRREDSLIAWTWEQYRRNNTGPELLARLPMTKAAVRAMDTITDLMASVDDRFDLQKYLVTGASKRGWTAWTTAAVDDERVIGFAPLVLTSLNFVDDLNHHYQVLGNWSFALSSYYDEDLTCHLNDPDIQKIFDIVDPYAYIDRYTMPKLVIAATGDQFFLPDDSHFFWDDLPEPKYLNLIPNAEHTMTTGIFNVLESARSFFYSITTGYPLPTMTWDKEYTETGGKITVYMDTNPNEVKVWSSRTRSTTRRDYRLTILNETNPDQMILNPVLWFSREATQIEENMYTAEFDSPSDGWLGFFIQVKFPGPKEGLLWDLLFTSEVLIIPNKLPFEKCQGDECCGSLI